MKKYVDDFNLRVVKIFMVFAMVLVFAGFMNSNVNALDVSVVDETGTPVPAGYRWLLEEDNTHPVIPGRLVGPITESTPALSAPGDSLSLSIHKSHAPALAKGDDTNIGALTLDPAKKYFLSVLPKGTALGGVTHALGGTAIPAGHDPLDTVTVVTNILPLPTASISVMAFNDNAPLNGAPDFPDELVGSGTGLGGFDVLLFEAGGRYGASGGAVLQDCFGNPLGTTYQDALTAPTYDAEGNPVPLVMGSGLLRTEPNGTLIIRNLCPAKYGVQIVPPAGEGWLQTNTIEGTKTIDAWVKANEPTFFQEFGPPGHHVFIGFTKAINDPVAMTGAHSINGSVVNNHTSRPTVVTFFDGQAVNDCWVGLNDLSVGEGRAIYAQPCGSESDFLINNVKPGSYQLAVWDKNLDYIFGGLGITVDSSGDCVLAGGAVSVGCDLGNVPLFAWFGRVENTIFYDEDEDGFRDDPAVELGMFEQGTNIRWRDGTIYQSVPTDLFGYAPYDEIFPFFHWMVLEVDFARFKATGATITVDDGGSVDPLFGTDGAVHPQVQPLVNPNTGDNLSRTETGEVLTQAFQSFLGTTSIVDWGKALYGPGENGGISGVVMYAITRAEDDPEIAAAEPWEPGIPRVQVNLYADADADGVIDENDGHSDLMTTVTLADVDNYPLGWADGGTKGPEDIDRNYFGQVDGVFDAGDAVSITWTDSWDDNPPTGCVGTPGRPAGEHQPFYVYGNSAIQAQDCFEGLRTYDQVRPGVFDGGYAFGSYFPGGIDNPGGSVETSPIGAGTYIVEAAEIWGPDGTRVYEPLKSEDRNVDFGESYVPAPLLLPPHCVGDDYEVDAELTIFPGEPAPLAGDILPLCDRKQVTVKSGMSGGGTNAAADFFVFTAVPKASRVVGFILDDFSNEFDPNSPNFGEKYAPPWLPVTFRDYQGKVITRVYADQWGKYNALLPSTFTANVGMPSGMSPNMLTACMNDPGPIDNPDAGMPGEPALIIDPYYNGQFSQFCYTFQYMPGVTTYLDTPVLPIAAHASNIQNPLDCEFDDGTPIIHSVKGPGGKGPYVSAVGQLLTITSAGTISVSNPAFDGFSNAKIIDRDYGFGDLEGAVTIDGISLTDVVWANDVITGKVPTGSTGQLMVERDNGKSTVMGVTVTVGGPAPIYVAAGESIQAAIDGAAGTGELIIVEPGTYDEIVIIHKNVTLQGSGAYSTIISGLKPPFEKLQDWRDKMSAIVGDPLTSPKLCPNQEGGFNPVDNEPLLFTTEEGAVITVLSEVGEAIGRIDGFTLTGADVGGGIFVNCFVDGLEISNNKIAGNHGFLGGGIHVGHLFLANANLPIDADNDNLSIHHNHISQNGTSSAGNGGGGGIALYSGTHNYVISDNNICGNFSAADGGGIAHIGLSKNGLIFNNDVCFNQTFAQGTPASGGGIFVGGIRRVVEETPGVFVDTLSEGTGSVIIDSNLIQANLSGSGDGGGIRLSRINGLDVEASPDDSDFWHRITIDNNMIVNNVTGNAGAISMQDVARSRIRHNTVANNDSTATASAAFASPSASTPQIAGIVSRAHSDVLLGAIGTGAGLNFSGFSNPMLRSNIVLHNRSFHWIAGTGLVPNPSVPVFKDLGVEGTPLPEKLSPRNCFLTDRTGYPPVLNNIDEQIDSSWSGFVSGVFGEGYFNGSRGHLIIPEVGTALETVPAFDEGGNFIDVRFGPLTKTNPVTGLPFGNYHLQATSDAVDAGENLGFPVEDFDKVGVPPVGDTRPNGVAPDIGADELAGAGAPASSIVVTVEYVADIQKLRVFATSSLDENANLMAQPAGRAAKAMKWNSNRGRWQKQFSNVTTNPGIVTITGAQGIEEVVSIP